LRAYRPHRLQGLGLKWILYCKQVYPVLEIESLVS